MELGTFSTGRNGKVDRFENKARERRSFADFPKVPVGMMSRIYIYICIYKEVLSQLIDMKDFEILVV